MTLDDFITANDMTEAQAAVLIGVDQSTVNRLRKGQIPSPAVMKRVAEVTAGAVTPNDFFGIVSTTVAPLSNDTASAAPAASSGETGKISQQVAA